MSLIFNSGTQLKTYDSKNKTKKCSNPLCGNVHKTNSFFCSCFGTDPFKNKNIADLNVSGFLPHLPYSWSRSLTNLNMLLKVIEDVLEAQKLYGKDGSNIKKHILQSFLHKGLITVDSTKINDLKYIKGGPERRVAEYLLTLQVLHLIDESYNLTSLGNFFVETKNTMILFLSFYILKIKNKFLKDKAYYFFNVRHFKNLFKILEQEKKLSLEEFMFLLMAHEEEDYQKVHYNFFKNTTNSNLRTNIIQSYFLGKNNAEMGRQKGAIFNVLVSANILHLDNESKLYSLTQESKKCMEFISKNNTTIEEIIENIYSEDSAEMHLNKLMDLFKNILKENKPTLNELINKSGGKHENNMLKMFSKSNINFRKYDKSFIHIKLPANVLSSLSGGTEHNPDHLCTIRNTSVLVDSKSSNSINGEIHKVIAYNGYAKEANTKTFIFLDNIMPNKTLPKLKELINENPDKIERIALFTKNAIDLLCKKNIVKQKFEEIYKANNFLLVCSKIDKNYLNLEKEIPNSLYIID